MHKQIKQNPKTNQMKPKQFKWNPIKPTAKHTHTTQPRERSQEEKRVWEIGGQEVLTYDGWQRGSRRWRWRSVLRAAVGIDSPSGDGNRFSERRWRRWEAAVAACCWEWGFVWESWLYRVIDLSFSWEIWAESEGFFVVERELQSCLTFGFFLVFCFFYLY